MNSNDMSFGVVMVYLILLLGGLLGWGMNISKLIDCDFEAPYKAEIIRGVGVPIGIVGAVVGYMDIDDTPK